MANTTLTLFIIHVLTSYGIFCKEPSIKTCTNETNCCTNYYNTSRGCVACPNGTYGVNCSVRCPVTYYGLFCSSKCKCSGFRACDATDGKCRNGETTETNFSLKDVPLWLWIIIGFASVILSLGCIGSALSCRSRSPRESDIQFREFLDMLSTLRNQQPSQAATQGVQASNDDMNTVLSSNPPPIYNYIDQSEILSSDDKPLSQYPPRSASPDIPAGNNGTMYGGDENSYDEGACSKYNTLSRPEKTIPLTNGSTSLLKKTVEEWNKGKPKDYLRKKKWFNAVNSKKNDDMYKVMKRRKSAAISSLRQGIKSVFRSSKGKFNIKEENKDQGSSTTGIRYSCVKLPSNDITSGLQLPSNDITSGVQLPSNDITSGVQLPGAVGGVEDLDIGNLPPPPDVWFCQTDNTDIRNENGSLHFPRNDLYDLQRNHIPGGNGNITPLQETDIENESKRVREYLIQKCAITKGAIAVEKKKN